MNITYLKPHNGNKPGDTEEVPEGLGNYLIRCKIAAETPSKPKQEKKPRQTKELKQEMETK